MITRKEYDEACREALARIQSAGIQLNPTDRNNISAADFGLSRLRKEGIQILTLFDTERIAGKILVLFPHQTIPEHWHPPVNTDPGKEEIIRAIEGDLFFYLPGDQLIIPPGTKHWFQAGQKGAVLYSFSSTSRDILDGFTDPSVVRKTTILE